MKITQRRRDAQNRLAAQPTIAELAAAGRQARAARAGAAIAVLAVTGRGVPIVSLARVVAAAREIVWQKQPKLRGGRRAEYGTEEHGWKRRWGLAVSAEVDRLLAELGVPCEVGLATATSGNPAAPKPKPFVPTSAMRTKRMTGSEFSKRLSAFNAQHGDERNPVFVAPRPCPAGMRIKRIPMRPGFDADDAADQLDDFGSEYLGSANGFHLFAVGKRQRAA